jgi:hypothetical protein
MSRGHARSDASRAGPIPAASLRARRVTRPPLHERDVEPVDSSGLARGPAQVTDAREVALRGGSVVVLQQSTQPRTTGDRTAAVSRRRRGGEEHSVAHVLMVPFVMVVFDEFVNRTAQ